MKTPKQSLREFLAQRQDSNIYYESLEYSIIFIESEGGIQFHATLDRPNLANPQCIWGKSVPISDFMDKKTFSYDDQTLHLKAQGCVKYLRAGVK